MSLSKEVIKITEEEKGIRADKFLALKIEGVSRNFIQGLFDDGKILINGKAECDLSFKQWRQWVDYGS